MSTSEDVQAMMTGMTQIPKERQAFAADLVKSFARHGHLTDRQATWAARLARMARGEVVGEPAKVEDLMGVVDLFDRAARNLKWPKLTFDHTEVGVPLQLSRAGAHARQPGSVNLTDGGRYGSNRWYGRIERSGTFVASQDCPPELVGFLHRLSGDTANVAAMYGRRTGCCCFCNSQLTDERSIEVGYGPVCARKWGLPWGAKPKHEKEDRQLQLAA